MTPTAQEIQQTQGTRLQDTAPWQSYDSEMDSKMSPELAAQVAEYASKRYTDAPLSAESQEVLAENREINEGIAKQYQWVTKSEYENEEARVGVVMTHSEFITKLRKCGLVCFYRQHPHNDKAVLYISRNGIANAELACWVQINGPMPELSMFNFDQYGVPLAEKRRGWRTCLLQILLKEFVTEDQANKEFGKPKLTSVFSRYNSIIYGFRNRKKDWNAQT